MSWYSLRIDDGQWNTGTWGLKCSIYKQIKGSTYWTNTFYFWHLLLNSRSLLELKYKLE